MIETTDLGTYVEHAGRPAVRFVRTYPHPIERVWSAITAVDELKHWFPSTARIEQRVGGTVTFSDDPHLEDATGTVLACDPPRRLAYSWGGDELHYELEPLADGGCRLTLINVLHEQNTAARNAAGWTVCLVGLDRLLAGHPIDGPHGESAVPWEPIYRQYVESGMPSGAEIPSSS